MGQLAKNWASSYLGNFVGSLLMVWVVACTGLLATAPAPLNIAVAKTSLTFGQVSLSLFLKCFHVCRKLANFGLMQQLRGVCSLKATSSCDLCHQL